MNTIMKTLFVLLMVSIFCKANNVVVKNNIVYRPIREVSTSKAHWNIALMLDLRAFPFFLTGLQTQVLRIQGFIEIAKSQLKEDKVAKVEPLINTLNEVEKGLVSFKSTRNVLHQEYHDLTQLLHPRTTRSLLPLGGVFKFLFGVADDRDISSIKQSVSQLAKSQKEVLHVVEHSLSILNTSRIEISQNRDTINAVLNTLENLKSEVNRQANRFERQFIQLTTFHELLNSVKSMVSGVRQLFIKAELYLVNFKIKMNMLSLQHLAPSLVSASHLRELLQDIDRHIPQGFMLPLDLETELWNYYSSLKCSTVINSEYLAVIISVPLKPVSSSFTLMSAMSFPIPYDNSSAPVKLHENSKHLTAFVSIESSYFLMDDKHSQFVLLTDIEAKECLQNNMPFCEIDKGLSSTYNSEICVIGSYLDDTDVIENNCITMVSASSRLPLARAITKSQWLIITNSKLLFTIKCLNGSSSTVSIHPPTSIIDMPHNCQGYSSRINLPLFLEHNQTEKFHSNLVMPPLQINNISMSKIWKPVHTELANFSNIHIPKMLKRVQQLPIDSLIDQIKNIESSDGLNLLPWYSNNWVIIIGSFGGIIISATLIFFIYKKGRKCLNNKLLAISSQKRWENSKVSFAKRPSQPEEVKLIPAAATNEVMIMPSAPAPAPVTKEQPNVNNIHAYTTQHKQGPISRPFLL